MVDVGMAEWLGGWCRTGDWSRGGEAGEWEEGRGPAPAVPVDLVSSTNTNIQGLHLLQPHTLHNNLPSLSVICLHHYTMVNIVYIM